MESFRDDITFYAGATWEDTYAWTDEAGTLVDTAGYEAKMQIRPTVDGDVALELSTANGYVTVGKVNEGTANEYNVKYSVPAAVTGAVEDFGKGVFDLELTDNTGRVRRLVYGYVWYSPQITRE